MKETSFIEQNKEKWNRFEKLSENDSSDPSELSDLYMDITDDLSFAQTFYKRRTVRVYLNQLAQRVYTGVHIHKAESFKKFITVWKVSLPIEIYKARKNLLFALVVFLIWAGLAVITTHYFPKFPNLILTDEYVRMTNDNIAHNDPLAVYKGGDQFQMFVSITTNNIRVSFLTFIFGIFFTIGTHILLFKNAMMVGSFQYFFASKGLLITSFLGIWIHGAFEISSIVLAAGAGITMGNGWLFPRNYTRLQSLQIASKSGLKIMLSLVPFIIFAGFFESYVTRNYMELPEWSKWLLIGTCFALILFYYVVYPIIVARKYPALVEENEVINYKPSSSFSLDIIRTMSQQISDTFRFYSVNFTKLIQVNLKIILPLILVLTYFQNQAHADLMRTEHWFDWSKQLEIMIGFGFSSFQDWIAIGCWSIFFSGMFLSVLYTFSIKDSSFMWSGFFQFAQKRFVAVWVGNFLLFFSLIFIPWYWYFVLIFLIPLFYLNGIVPGITGFRFSESFKNGWKYSTKSYGQSILNILIFTLIFALFMQPIALVLSIRENFDPKSIINITEPILPDLLDLLADFIKNIAEALGGDRIYWSNIARQLVYILFYLLVFPIWIISLVFLASNEHEKATANGLKKLASNFGKRSRTQENEVDFE